MAYVHALKRSITSSFLCKTLTKPISPLIYPSRSIFASTSSTLFNANNPITSGLRFFQSGAKCKNIMLSDRRNIADHKRRVLFEKYEVKRMLYKAGLRDPDLPAELRERFRYKLSMLPRNSSATRIRNRCILTGRPRGVYRRFRISRISFRDLALRGLLPGVTKASW